MLTILLLSVGIFSAVQAFGRGIFASNDAEMLEQGLALAQERMEQLRNTAFAAIVNQGRAPVAGWPGFERQVIVATPEAVPNGPLPGDDPNGPPTTALLKKVTVRVFWMIDPLVPANFVSTEIVTYIVNNA